MNKTEHSCNDQQVSWTTAKDAFTLVELLVVISIIALVMGLVVPAFNNMLRGRGIERAISDISSLVELARAEAQSNQTYVAVVFVDAINTDKVAELRAVAIKTLDGQQKTLDGKSMGSFDLLSNISPISKLVKVPNVKTVNFSGLPTIFRDKLLPAYVVWKADYRKNDGFYVTNRAQFRTGQSAYEVAGQNFNGGWVFVFTPSGEVLGGGGSETFTKTVQGSGLCAQQQINIGLVPTRGDGTDVAAQQKETDGAVISISGSTVGISVTRNTAL